MRKSLILMLIATLLVGAFLVSCNSDIAGESSNGDKLVKVTIAGNSKGISAIAGGDDADNYFWYYKASKNDTSVYRTGETVARTGAGTTESPYTNGAGGWTPVKKDSNGAIAGLSGADLGYFSTGDWLFSFAGFTEKVSFEGDTATGSTSQTAVTSAYYQSNLSVGVTAETHITVTLTAGTGLSGTATLVFAEGLDWVYTPENNTNAAATLAALSGKSAYMLVYTSEETDATPIAQSVPVNVALDNNDNPTKASVTFASFAPYGDTAPTVSAPVTVDASVEGIDYTFYFKVFVNNEGTEYQEVSTEVYTQSVKAYSNGTIVITKTGNAAVVDNESIKKVYIDGSYLPEIGAYSAKGSKEITVNSTTSPEVVFETAITPVSTEVTTVVYPQATDNKKTTVLFPAGSFVDSGATTDTTKSIEMEVVIYKTEEAATNSTFTVSGGNTFAGLDLSVDLITTTTSGTDKITTTESVSSFNNQSVTVTTYIAKNLSNVTVANGAGTTGNAPQVVSYDSETGKLVFTTTHFSEFAVGADQNVYDKTTNAGYIIASTGENKGKYVTSKTGDTLLTAVPSITDELLLLKSDLANVVDDAYDAFNAGYKWSTVHAANDTPSELFDGGYGTKIEPYLVASTAKMHNISELYNDGDYSYYVFTGSTANPIDCSTWKPIKLKGSFDGKGVVFSNLPVQLFEVVGGDTNNTHACVKNFTIKDVYMVVTGYYCAPVVDYTENLALLTIDNVKASGYAEADIVTSFVGWSKASATVIKNSESSLILVSTNNQVSGFVGNSLGTNTVTVIDSIYNGSEASTAAAGQYLYAHNNGNCTLTLSYTSDFVSSHSNLYPAFSNKAQQLNSYSIYTQISKSSLELPSDVGTPITVQKDANAVKAIATYVIGVNPGNFTRVFQRDDIDLSNVSENTFNTNTVKKYNIVINDGVHGNGAIDNTQYISDLACDGTYHCVVFTVVQYDENKAITSIRTTSLPGNNQ